VEVNLSRFDGRFDLQAKGDGFYLRVGTNNMRKAVFLSTSQCASYTYAYLLLNFRIAVDEYNLV
jgi:hypothetical protein